MNSKKTRFNIAIYGLSGVSKSSIGYQVAEQLNFTFIDSGLFYQYIADLFYFDDMIQFNKIHLFTNEIIYNPSYYLQEIKFHLQEKKITRKIANWTKGFRNLQEEFGAIAKVFSDLLKRNIDTFDLVLEAKKVATIINTSDLSIGQVVAKILSHVLWVKFGDNNMLHLIIFILFVFVYTLCAYFLEKIKSNYSEQIKANSQVDSSDLQKESFTSQIKEFTVQKLIVLKNWELANYIADKAYAQLIAKLEERHEFMNYLKEFYELQVTNYEKIGKEVLPKNCSDDKKLFKDA
ncbi:cytidylate kinase [Gigaspora margarita]|uniref:(d)CMP kinase n=1 Tax=Gigaspora margarita TaxID=4874 RepID=A0A8H3X4H5_GIGMA|nr:cytidylate kinase [Gigaspora margarita]